MIFRTNGVSLCSVRASESNMIGMILRMESQIALGEVK